MGYGKLVSLEIVKIHQFVSLTTDNVIYQKKKKMEEKLTLSFMIKGGHMIGS